MSIEDSQSYNHLYPSLEKQTVFFDLEREENNDDRGAIAGSRTYERRSNSISLPSIMYKELDSKYNENRLRAKPPPYQETTETLTLQTNP